MTFNPREASGLRAVYRRFLLLTEFIISK